MKTIISYNSIKRQFFVTLVFLLITFTSFGQGLKVAIAANLQGVIKVLQKDFKEKTGIDITPIVGSSGNLTTQIKNGAPYDVFLSADMTYPDNLYKEGFSTKDPAVYAYGALIVCSTQDIGLQNWERELMSPRVKKIAIANPSIAPYGKAAEEALKNKGILDDIKSKMVYGESIAQVNTYITSGVADVGFTTQAFIKDSEGKIKLYWQPVDSKLYEPLKQGMIVIKQSKELANAQKFYDYMLSQSARKILHAYGYGLVNQIAK